jgi:hypothetical protein
MTMEPPDTSTSALQAHLKRLWIHGFLAGVGVLFVIFLISYFIWGWPFATQEDTEETKPTPPQAVVTPVTPPAPAPKIHPPPSPAVKPPAPPAAELAAVLAKLEVANQKKDLHQLMSLYSPSFPDLPQKIQEISRSWDAYDYLSLNFKLTEINFQTPDSASARVTWKIKARHRQTKKIKDIIKVYLVRFTCESGQWRIKSLGKVEKVASRDKPS